MGLPTLKTTCFKSRQKTGKQSFCPPTNSSPKPRGDWEGTNHSRHIAINHVDRFLPEWNIKSIPSSNPRYLLGLRVRNSKRWYESFHYPTSGFKIPYIDELGRFSGCNLYKWNTDPRIIVSSIVSTIYQRLLKHTIKHNRTDVMRVFRAHQLILKCATYYALTKNLYFLNRILFLLKNLRKNISIIQKLCTWFACKMDDSRRFVFSQVYIQTNWLTFRVARPRDKSLVRGVRTETSWGDSRRFSKLQRSSFIWNIAVAMCQL